MSFIVKDGRLYDTLWDMYLDEFDDYNPDSNPENAERVKKPEELEPVWWLESGIEMC